MKAKSRRFRFLALRYPRHLASRCAAWYVASLPANGSDYGYSENPANALFLTCPQMLDFRAYVASCSQDHTTYRVALLAREVTP